MKNERKNIKEKIESPKDEHKTVVALYARVSTKDKEQNPENQLIKLREYCKARNYSSKEYTDHASGAKKDRPGLIELMSNEQRCNDVYIILMVSYIKQFNF